MLWQKSLCTSFKEREIYGDYKKEYNYFTGFCEVGQLARESAAYLKNVVNTFSSEEIETYAAEMHRLEHQADAKRHELCNHLVHEFMPPIEREDISLLSQKLDNIVDTVEDVMRRLYMFHVTEMRREAADFARLVADSCDILHKLLSEFSDYKKSKALRSYIIEINTLENKGDTLHADSIRRLFTDKERPVNQLVWTKIFESFESCLDACEDVAELVDSILTKNT